MANVIARIKIKGKNYEITVDVDKALAFKKGQGSIDEVLAMDDIFYDSKKGLHVSDSDLKDAFGTDNVREIAEKIIKQGEIQIPKEHKDEEREKKKKQVIEFFSKYAFDPNTNNPHTPERISSAIKQAGVNIDNKPIEQQISRIIAKVKEVLPLKVESKRLKLRIPSEHTGKAYGIVQEYKESENWLSNGDLEIVVSIPVGLLDNFYDKINSITHGSVMSKEIKEE